jgi:peptide/nickel transport system permease protein
LLKKLREASFFLKGNRLLGLNSFKKRVKNPHVFRAILWLGFLIFVAFFKNFMACEPTGNSFPPPLIPYASTTLDYKNAALISPFAQQPSASLYHRHWLGTDAIGRDTTAGLLSGARIALLVGFGSMFIALLIGLAIGVSAGFWGDYKYKTSVLGGVLKTFLWLLFFFYLMFYLQLAAATPKLAGVSMAMLFIFFILCLWGLNRLEKCLFLVAKTKNRFNFLLKPRTFPLDLCLMRFTEIFQAVPSLLWLLALLAILQQVEIPILILLIGATSWVSIARLARAEVLRVRTADFIQAAEGLGIGDAQIVLKHILPNIATPIWVAACFGIANCILAESFLAFIGLGLPPEVVSWGNMLAQARSNFSAWWLVIFPGLAIFLTLYAFNTLADAFRKL